MDILYGVLLKRFLISLLGFPPTSHQAMNISPRNDMTPQILLEHNYLGAYRPD